MDPEICWTRGVLRVSFTVTHLPLQSGPQRSGWKDLLLCGYKLWSSPQRDCMASGCRCSKHIGTTPREEYAPLSKMMCLFSWMPGCSQSHHRSGILWPWAGRLGRKSTQDKWDIMFVYPTTTLIYLKTIFQWLYGHWKGDWDRFHLVYSDNHVSFVLW